jgi:hypothetical protein
VAASWYAQRVDGDVLHTHTMVMEQAFRRGLAAPGDAGATFGHAAWSAFHYQLAAWRSGPPRDDQEAVADWKRLMAASDLRDSAPRVRLRWEAPAGAGRGTEAPGFTTLAQGTATVGFRPRQWRLERAVAPEGGGRATYPHRPLPLTRQEWVALLQDGTTDR